MDLSLTKFQLFQFFSYSVNAFFLLLWVKKSIIFKEFLVGRWEGSLKPDDGSGDSIDCTLMIAKANGRDNSAFILYRCEDIPTGKKKYAGADRLVEEKCIPVFTWRRTWSALFFRFCHTDFQENGDKSQDTPNEKPPQYVWECDVKSIFFSPKMDVKITGEEVGYTGTFSKH